MQLAMPQSRRTMSPANDFRAEKGWKVMLDFACCIFIYNIYIYIYLSFFPGDLVPGRLGGLWVCISHGLKTPIMLESCSD